MVGWPECDQLGAMTTAAATSPRNAEGPARKKFKVAMAPPEFKPREKKDRISKLNAEERRDCPYLGTINRNVLDFDFAKVCSVTLTNQNVYCDLVDGKYFQGRGRNTEAHAHALSKMHYVWMNLANGKVFCVPDDYEVVDHSLEDIKYNLNPTFKEEDVDELEKKVQHMKSLDGTDFIPGFVGMNNVKRTDYLIVVAQALKQVVPLRKFFLLLKPSEKQSADRVVTAFGELMRKLYNPKNFKGIVSPEVFLQAVGNATAKRFFTMKQQDPVAFLCWLLGHLHQKTKSKGKSIVHDSLQGQMAVKTARVGEEKDWSEENVPFLFLTLDLPPPPLFKDDVEFIPQIPLFTLLDKFNGESSHETANKKELKRYSLHKLPPFLMMQYKRFQDNQFYVEKNPTIVNFPLKNLDLRDYLHPEWAPRAPCTSFDLIANIVHDGKYEKGSFKIQVLHPAMGQWFEIQDLRVTPIMPQMVALSESYFQIYKRQDVKDDGTFEDLLPEVEMEDRSDVADEPAMDELDADELAEAGIIIG